MNVPSHLHVRPLLTVYDDYVVADGEAVDVCQWCVTRPYVRALITSFLLTCSQEAMSGQQQLRRDLHFGLALMFEGGEVSLILIGSHFFPVAIISCEVAHTQQAHSFIINSFTFKRLK